MNWLDKVKACNPFDPENRKRVYMEVPIPDAELALRVMERSWRQLELDRFIEIAERAEWGNHYDSLLPSTCPICFCDEGDVHSKDCPYHDDWRKE